MSTVTLTTAQALVRYLAAQRIEIDGELLPLCPGMFAIFGHGNVAGMGAALAEVRDRLPTHRAHNEQAMAHTAAAFAKAWRRRRFMACTTSIGPGATNLVTAAAGAHINRLPLLLLPGDVFASHRPDPVLQQLENPSDPHLSVNDCLRPVSRLWERISSPAQIPLVLPAAIATLLDPVDCGPVTLALPQDVQVTTFDFPERFFAPNTWSIRKPAPEPTAVAHAANMLRASQRPLVIAGGGVHYGGAAELLAQLAAEWETPVAETQAGKGALPWDHPMNVGALGVTGSSAANQLAAEADLVVAIGTRLTDFTTASRTLFADGAHRLAINVDPTDANKHGNTPLIGDVDLSLRALAETLDGRHPATPWTQRATQLTTTWNDDVRRETKATGPVTDAQVVGAVNRWADDNTTVVCAAGGLPGELHKLWRALNSDSYHVEYGYSCMGYEIAGGLGVKMAKPRREVVVLVGDGSYLMMNTEIVAAVAQKQKLIVVLVDNRGFGCIHRLQKACGQSEHNNLLPSSNIDFAAHARSMGAHGERVSSVAELSAALNAARKRLNTSAIVIETDPTKASNIGGAFWDVPVKSPGLSAP